MDCRIRTRSLEMHINDVDVDVCDFPIMCSVEIRLNLANM